MSSSGRKCGGPRVNASERVYCGHCSESGASKEKSKQYKRNLTRHTTKKHPGEEPYWKLAYICQPCPVPVAQQPLATLPQTDQKEKRTQNNKAIYWGLTSKGKKYSFTVNLDGEKTTQSHSNQHKLAKILKAKVENSKSYKCSPGKPFGRLKEKELYLGVHWNYETNKWNGEVEHSGEKHLVKSAGSQLICAKACRKEVTKLNKAKIKVNQNFGKKISQIAPSVQSLMDLRGLSSKNKQSYGFSSSTSSSASTPFLEARQSRTSSQSETEPRFNPTPQELQLAEMFDSPEELPRAKGVRMTRDKAYGSAFIDRQRVTVPHSSGTNFFTCARIVREFITKVRSEGKRVQDGYGVIKFRKGGKLYYFGPEADKDETSESEYEDCEKDYKGVCKFNNQERYTVYLNVKKVRLALGTVYNPKLGAQRVNHACKKIKKPLKNPTAGLPTSKKEIEFVEKIIARAAYRNPDASEFDSNYVAVMKTEADEEQKKAFILQDKNFYYSLKIESMSDSISSKKETQFQKDLKEIQTKLAESDAENLNSPEVQMNEQSTESTVSSAESDAENRNSPEVQMNEHSTESTVSSAESDAENLNSPEVQKDEQSTEGTISDAESATNLNSSEVQRKEQGTEGTVSDVIITASGQKINPEAATEINRGKPPLTKPLGRIKSTTKISIERLMSSDTDSEEELPPCLSNDNIDRYLNDPKLDEENSLKNRTRTRKSWVGRKVMVKWDGEWEWYEGRVKNIVGKLRYRVFYPCDGTTEIIDIQNQTWRFIDYDTVANDEDLQIIGEPVVMHVNKDDSTIENNKQAESSRKDISPLQKSKNEKRFDGLSHHENADNTQQMFSLSALNDEMPEEDDSLSSEETLPNEVSKSIKNENFDPSDEEDFIIFAKKKPPLAKKRRLSLSLFKPKKKLTERDNLSDSDSDIQLDICSKIAESPSKKRVSHRSVPKRRDSESPIILKQSSSPMSSPLRGLKIPKKRKRNASNPLVFFRAGYKISFEMICVSGKENDEPVPNKRSRQRSANELVNDVLRNIDLSEPDVVQALLAQTQAALLKTVPITNPLLTNESRYPSTLPFQRPPRHSQPPPAPTLPPHLQFNRPSAYLKYENFTSSGNRSVPKQKKLDTKQKNTRASPISWQDNENNTNIPANPPKKQKFSISTKRKKRTKFENPKFQYSIPNKKTSPPTPKVSFMDKLNSIHIGPKIVSWKTNDSKRTPNSNSPTLPPKQFFKNRQTSDKQKKRKIDHSEPPWMRNSNSVPWKRKRPNSRFTNKPAALARRSAKKFDNIPPWERNNSSLGSMHRGPGQQAVPPPPYGSEPRFHIVRNKPVPFHLKNYQAKQDKINGNGFKRQLPPGPEFIRSPIPEFGQY